MQAHIDELAADLGVQIVQRYNMSGMMYVEYEPPMIEIPTLEISPTYKTVAATYLTALHELGHVFHGHTQGRPPFPEKRYYFDHGVLRCEAEAWDWALDQNRYPITKAEVAFMLDYCLMSYYRGSVGNARSDNRLGNGNRHHVAFKYDEPDEFFWNVVERMRDAPKAGLLQTA